MNLRHGLVKLALLLSAAPLSPAVASPSGDCSTIVSALAATVKAPGVREYVSLPGHGGSRSERLIAVLVGPTAYLAIGGPGGWQKIDRAEIKKMADEESGSTTYRDCRSLGTDPVDGVAATMFEASKDDKDGGGSERVKIWVGGDGLVHKQQTEAGTVRFEFGAVTPPIP